MSVPTATRFRLPLSSPQAVSDVAAALWAPADDADRHGVILAPSAGGDLSSPLLLTVARGLAARGYPVMAFNFAYAEAGRGRPDAPARLESAYRDALAAAREQMGARPLVLGGRSMGGRIATHLAAQQAPCAGLVLLGYPLHPRVPASERGRIRPERLRTTHWPDLAVPVLFVSGDRDQLCDLTVLAREREHRLAATTSQLHVVAGADHAFKVRKADGRTTTEVSEEIVGAAAAWLDELPLAEVDTGSEAGR